MELVEVLRKSVQTLCVVGEREKVLAGITRFFYSEKNRVISRDTDTLILSSHTCTIADARLMQTWTQGNPQHYAEKILILAPYMYAREAQQALLKTLEEPLGNTRIIFVVKKESDVLPTILSRALVYTFKGLPLVTDMTYFLQLQPHARLVNPQVQPFFEKDPTKRPPKEMLYHFFESLVYSVEHTEWTHSIDKKSAFAVMRDVTQYIDDTGASMKILVEYVCLRMPKF